MNLIALLIGVATAYFIVRSFSRKSFNNKVRAYSFLLFTFPLYYFVFALYAGDYQALPLELLFSVVFFASALIALETEPFWQMLILAIGYLLHGFYDVLHDTAFVNLGTPTWWPEFCGSVDLLLGVYLLYLGYKTVKTSV